MPDDLAPAPAPRSVVVVGAGLAGSQAVSALREQGFTGRITWLGAEGLEPYDRPPLSKELLSRTEPAWLTAELGLDLGAADDLRLDVPATGLQIGPDGVRVRIADGDVQADAAVLATGAHAVRVPDWDGGITLHTAADAAVLRDLLGPGRRLVVVGAGWIGAEVAGVAAAHGCEVTVVEAASTPLRAALGETVGGLTAPWYAAAGVRLVTATPVLAVRGGSVELAGGEVLTADVVLVAVGARPTSAWLTGSLPLEADGTVPVDEGYRVLTPDGPLRTVVAVGDLVRRWSPRHGWVPGGHWDGALRAPAVAVRSLLEPDASGPAADPAPYVFSTQLGHELGLYGLPGPSDDVVLRGAAGADEGFGALWFRAGTDELTAVLAVDRPRDVGAARRLFTAPTLPRLDRTVAADPGRQLRDAVL